MPACVFLFTAYFAVRRLLIMRTSPADTASSPAYMPLCNAAAVFVVLLSICAVVDLNQLIYRSLQVHRPCRRPLPALLSAFASMRFGTCQILDDRLRACARVCAQIKTVHISDQLFQCAHICLRSRVQACFAQRLQLPRRSLPGSPRSSSMLCASASLSAKSFYRCSAHSYRCWRASRSRARSHVRARSYPALMLSSPAIALLRFVMASVTSAVVASSLSATACAAVIAACSASRLSAV